MPNTGFDRLLRKKQILELTGISYVTLHDWIKRGWFPEPVVINASPNTKRELVAWA